MIRRLVCRARGLLLGGLRGAGRAARAGRRTRRSKCRSSPSTTSTAISKRRPIRSRSPSRRQRSARSRRRRRGAARRGARPGCAPGIPTRSPSSAGDTIGASPLDLGLFPRRADDRCDEPARPRASIRSAITSSTSGCAELMRMQAGGCEKYTRRVPCRLEPFAGARFQYLAANVVRGDGSTIFPATAISAASGRSRSASSARR